MAHACIFLLYILLIIWYFINMTSLCSGENNDKNILFIVSDDLRPQLNSFLRDIDASRRMYTPNLDGLAKKSLVFNRTYCQYALCSPSRTSVLTGRRPDTTKTNDLNTYFRKVAGNFTTLPQYFKLNGYVSLGVGKIFHQGKASGNNDPISWSTPQSEIRQDRKFGYPWKALRRDKITTTKDLLHDEKVTKESLTLLNELGSNISLPDSRAFFLAVGFRKPHLPWEFPEEFLTYYVKEYNITLPSNKYIPVNGTSENWYGNKEMGSAFRSNKTLMTCVKEFNKTLLPKQIFSDLIRAYYASVSFMDYQVGVILDGLRKNNLEDSTIIVFWGDHGFHLGENGIWGKKCNFEVDARVPLMIHIPGFKESHGKTTNEIVELVDLYPTLVEAAGFPPMPKCPISKSNDVTYCTEGKSLLYLFHQNISMSDRQCAFTQVLKTSVMGYSIRCDRFRYTEWIKFQNENFRARWDKPVVSSELYDHQKDPGETRNIASLDTYKDTIARLSKMLRNQFDKSNSSNTEFQLQSNIDSRQKINKSRIMCNEQKEKIIKKSVQENMYNYNVYMLKEVHFTTLLMILSVTWFVILLLWKRNKILCI